MTEVVWDEAPSLQSPLLVVAFEGFGVNSQLFFINELHPGVMMIVHIIDQSAVHVKN